MTFRSASLSVNFDHAVAVLSLPKAADVEAQRRSRRRKKVVAKSSQE